MLSFSCCFFVFRRNSIRYIYFGDFLFMNQNKNEQNAGRHILCSMYALCVPTKSSQSGLLKSILTSNLFRKVLN